MMDSSGNLVNEFFNWKITKDSPTRDQVHPYLVLQAFDVWNQFRNVMNIFRVNCQGA